MKHFLSFLNPDCHEYTACGRRTRLHRFCIRFWELPGASQKPHATQQGWAKIKSWFHLIWFEWSFGNLDSIWRIFLIAWFDLTSFKNRAIWFDVLFAWCDSNLRNRYRSTFRLKSWIQANPLTPIDRARWELSIGVIFVYETSFCDLIMAWFCLRPKFWFEIGIKSWFDLTQFFA